MITITPIELATLIAEGKPIELIDVRSTKEFEEIRIPGALSAPLGKNCTRPKLFGIESSLRPNRCM